MLVITLPMKRKKSSQISDGNQMVSLLMAMFEKHCVKMNYFEHMEQYIKWLSYSDRI